MADKGIIFSAPMVRALLDGRKTQTRRLIKDAPKDGRWHCDRGAVGLRWVAEGGSPSMPCRVPYAPADRLYVRERLWVVGDGIRFDEGTGDNAYCYEDTNHAYHAGRELWLRKVRDDQRAVGIPSIHMPRWASRLTLLVTDVRVQRVAEISASDCYAEGIQRPTGPFLGSEVCARDNARNAFRSLWDSLHGKSGERWDDNPWIVAVTFDVRQGNIDRAEQ